MGAAPTEDSHLRVAQVAVCIRALLSIVNGTQKFLAPKQLVTGSFYVIPTRKRGGHRQFATKPMTFRRLGAAPFAVLVRPCEHIS